MPEKLIPVYTDEAVYVCDSCSKGTLVFNGNINDDMKFEHDCTECKKSFLLTKHYPHLVHIPAEEKEDIPDSFIRTKVNFEGIDNISDLTFVLNQILDVVLINPSDMSPEDADRVSYLEKEGVISF
jgi:hypothetical protein